MEETSYAHELTFESEHILEDQIYGKRPLQKFDIYPNASRAWNFTLLTTFLNELDDFAKPSRRGFTITCHEGRSSMPASIVLWILWRPWPSFALISQTLPPFLIMQLTISVVRTLQGVERLRWLRRGCNKEELLIHGHPYHHRLHRRK